MIIKKIILASCILLAGCTSANDEIIYIDEDTYPTEVQPAPQKEVIQYIASSVPNTPQSDYSPAPKYSVFDILNRNQSQISKIYAETTRKVSLTEPEDEEEPEMNTVQTAVEEEEDVEDIPSEHKDYTEDCITYCGEGYFYDRDGEELNGLERICIKYPLPCGEKCRKDWYIQPLIYDTNYTCYEAIQKES